MENYYTILNLPPTASQAEIRERFRFLANAYHPDKFASPTHKARAEAEFKKINEAYQVLSVPLSRTQYDQHLQAAQAPQVPPRPPQKPRPAAPPPVSSSQRTLQIGCQILTTVASLLIFYALIFAFSRAGIGGLILLLILGGLIYSKYFWR